MDGERALIYSRIRENRLDPSENDLTRGARQQAVTQAATAKLTSPWTLRQAAVQRAGSLIKPLTTDLSAQRPARARLGEDRASGRRNTLYCRLGGDPASAGGAAVIIPCEDNVNALAMWAGNLGPAAADDDLRPRLRRGPPAAVALRVGRASWSSTTPEPDEPSSRRDGDDESDDRSPTSDGVRRRAGAATTSRSRPTSRRPSPPCVRPCRSRSSRTPSPCSAPRPGAARAGAASAPHTSHC